MARREQALVLALDLGSSSVRTALFNERGARLHESIAAQTYAVRYAADGAAVLNAEELLRATRQCVAKTLRRRQKNIPIIAVSGSAFWHSLLGLDRNRRPLTPVFTWADSRSTSDAMQLRRELSERAIQQRTGCMLRASFWPAKLRWLRRTDRTLFRQVAMWVSPAHWIFRELFGVDATGHSMASGTGMYDSRQRTWDAELCHSCGITPKQLGVLNDTPIGRSRFKELHEAEIFSAIGDGAASNLGSGADCAGLVAINIGTSAAVRTVQSARSRRLPVGLFRYVLDEERFVVGGAISNAGNLHQWCLRELQIGDEPAAERALSRTAAAGNALMVLPFLVSERAPTWPEGLRGVIAGLNDATSASDILLAETVATFYRLADILDQLEPATAPVEQVIVSGGILHSGRSLPILADCLSRDLHVCRALESSLRGAALHALASLGREASPLAKGKLIRHDSALAEKHRPRREAQRSLEQRMLAQ